MLQEYEDQVTTPGTKTLRKAKGNQHGPYTSLIDKNGKEIELINIGTEESPVWAVPISGSTGGGSVDGSVKIEDADDSDKQLAIDAAGKIGVSSLPDLEVDLTPTTIAGGIKTVTTAGTGEAIVATTTPAQYVIINALTTNTGLVYIGGSDVDKTTKNGIVLSVASDSSGVKVPGSCIIPIDDASKIYEDVTVNGEGVQFVIVN